MTEFLTLSMRTGAAVIGFASKSVFVKPSPFEITSFTTPPKSASEWLSSIGALELCMIAMNAYAIEAASDSRDKR